MRQKYGKQQRYIYPSRKTIKRGPAIKVVSHQGFTRHDLCKK